ncbi:hypothetical protein C0J52_24808 [Blattella germanica]|nr:hypothetical protein C0J52_24808 [Blattella germanica]
MKPAVVNELRRWTSEEAFGDITVTPDCTSRIVSESGGPVEIGSDDDTVDAGTDHRLPSPEEQVQTVAMRFPAEVVAVDVSGRAFSRMTNFRRSLIHVQVDTDGTVRRRNKRPRGRRRNTIAGTDQKELEQAITGDSPGTELPDLSADAITVVRSASSDLLRSKDDSPSEGKKSHFNTLKQWGKVKLKLIRSVSGESSKASTLTPEEVNIYETITAKGKKGELKHDKKSSSGKAVGSNIPISTSSGAMNMAVKLREGSVRRRALVNGKEDPLHSSSGNWSASSESGRASIGSENTATTHQPKSTTTLSSAATSSNSLNHHQAPSSTVSSRRKFLNTSASSSISEGTLTPDIMSDLVSPFPDDGETSSIYSCDTEGYYTSFHMDSGLKTLKEEESTSPQTPLHSTSALSNSPGRSNGTLTAENEYELFGKGSTSTTTSSAGTVCTTLLVGNDSTLSIAPAPAVPERKSSLEGKYEQTSQMVVAMIHKQAEGPSESPDSGHNTSSSPVDSTNSPPGTLTGRSSEYEFSESDLEGVDRIERIRVKTTINSSRIPSMCVITPPQSDDETSQYVPSYYSKRYKSHTLPDKDSKQLNIESALPKQSNSTAESSKPNYNSLPRTFEKQLSTDSDRSSEAEPSRVRSRSACRSVTPTGYGSVQQFERSASLKTRMRGPSPSPTRKAITTQDAQKLSNQQSKMAPGRKSSLQPFNNMIDKVKGVLSNAGSGRKSSKSSTGEESDSSPTETKPPPQVDAGDYVTIADVRNNKRATTQSTNMYSNIGALRPPEKLEYVSLNELPRSTRSTSPPTNLLISPSNSLERKRRQGARVTLDSEGKVVYSSDSLKRNKGAHTTFEPGPYVKDPSSTTPIGSPVSAHRIPKSNIRPVTISNQQGRNSPSITGGTNVHNSPVSQRNRSVSPRQHISPSRSNPTSPTSPQLGKVIIKAGSKTTPMSRVASPPLAVASRPMSPKPSSAAAGGRGAYVHMQSTHQRCTSPLGGRTTNSTATSPIEDDEGKIPPCPANPKLVASYLQRTNPALYNRINEQQTSSNMNPNKVKRSDSYRMANSPMMQTRKMTNIEIAAANENNPQIIQTFKVDTKLDPVKENRVLSSGNDKNKPMSDRNIVKTKNDSWKGERRTDGNQVEDMTLTKTVVNPNLLGRKFYGPQIKIDPNLFSANTTRPVTVPQDTERARVLNNAGQLLQGYGLPRGPPPRYVSPPPAQTQRWSSSGYSSFLAKQQDPQAFWTLPARRPQHEPSMAGEASSVTDYQHSGRFNTIATTGSGRSPNRNQYYPHYNDRPNYYGYTSPPPPAGASQSSHLSPPPQDPSLTQSNHVPLRNTEYSHQNPSVIQPNHAPMNPLYTRQPGSRHLTHATIPSVPRHDKTFEYAGPQVWQDRQNGFYSSTPTKKDRAGSMLQRDSTMMNLGTSFSPIQKYSKQHEIDKFGSIENKQQLSKSNHVPRSATPGLVSPPKTSMTSEEIFAAIHKSKKRMNIKTDSDNYSRSNSPSCSSMTSISPGSSESSVQGIGRSVTPVKSVPETGAFNVDNSPGSRHSWSPNSGEYYDFYSRFERRTPSPVTSPGSRQSWAGDRLGPRQPTSRNDFKRLLLQHGSKSNPHAGNGSSNGRISAVEQLRLTRQQKLGATSNGAVSNTYAPRSPAEKRTVTSKLLTSPRSNTGWRFASPRSDVLSSTILEDCAEEEKASRSPQDSPTSKHTNQAPASSFGNTSVRRPLNLSFDNNPIQFSCNAIAKQEEKSNTLQPNPQGSSPKTVTKCLANSLSTVKFLSAGMTSQNNVSPKITHLRNGSILSPELLSPSNVKENVNTNLQSSADKSTTGDSSLKIQQSLNKLILHSPSPRINMLLAKQRNHQYSNHGTTARSILGALTSSKSPPKTTLETAL